MWIDGPEPKEGNWSRARHQPEVEIFTVVVASEKIVELIVMHLLRGHDDGWGGGEG